MKKRFTLILTLFFVLGFSSPSFAAETTVEEDLSLDRIAELKAGVQLVDAKYKLKYDKESDVVQIQGKTENGEFKKELTGKEAKEKAVQFFVDVVLSQELSKEKIIDRLSEELGVQPGDIEKAYLEIKGVNGSKAFFHYKKGQKEVEQPLAVKNLNLHLKGEDHYRLSVRLNANNENVHAQVKKMDEDEKVKYKGIRALEEIQHLKSVFYWNDDSSYNAYLTRVSEELGVYPSEITLFQGKLQTQDGSKIHISYHR